MSSEKGQDTETTPWQVVADGVDIRVRVTPRGGRDAVDGVELLSDGRIVLKIRVRVPPEDGAANEAVRKLLAKTLKISASNVTLKAGATARLKLFHVAGEVGDLVKLLAQLTG